MGIIKEEIENEKLSDHIVFPLSYLFFVFISIPYFFLASCTFCFISCQFQFVLK